MTGRVPKGGEGLDDRMLVLGEVFLLAWREDGIGSSVCGLEIARWLTGSKIPAPGQTMSAPPNSLLATWNICSNCSQSLTSVFWKIALPEVCDGFECLETTSWASERRARSANITLQRLLRRRVANERLIP